MSVDFAALGLRAVGAFYIFAGVVALRAITMDRLMDGMLGALTGEMRAPRDTIRRLLLAGGAVLTLAGGVALALLHNWSPFLMLASALTQVVWLACAHQHFPPQDADDARGRRQTANAFVIYLLATAFVLLLWRSRAALFHNDAAVAGVILVTGAAGVLWHGVRSHLGRTPAFPMPDGHGVPPAHDRGEPPRFLRLAPFPGDWPMYDSDTGVRHDAARLGLPDDLVKRIAVFEQAVLAATDADHADGPAVTDAAAYDRLAREAVEIVTEMEMIWPGTSISWQMPGH
ncbi:MAG: hypothetical protein ACRCTD_02850 [Beijerinckiaceae bacterium]